MSDAYATKAELQAEVVKITARQDAYELMCATDRKRLDDDVRTVAEEVKQINDKMDGQNVILAKLDRLFSGVLATPRNRYLAQLASTGVLIYIIHWLIEHGVKL